MIVHPDGAHPHRRVFCNRTLNLGTIRAIGYDLDYTLVHYNVRAWEGKAYDYVKRGLLARGWPVVDLEFDPSLVMRGLVVDSDLGNLLKVDRFGYVKAALRGTERLPWPEVRRLYARTLVDLADPRYDFANTLFSLSEACIWTQLVPLLDAGALGPGLGPRELYDIVRAALNRTHVEGELKAEILADPNAYVEQDPDIARALLQQKAAGKKLAVVTNSDWTYTRAMLDHAIQPHLPAGTTWRELFDLVVVSARKPQFFSERAPMFELVTDDGMLRPVAGAPTTPAVCVGGHASLVEEALGVRGEDLLFVGDHVFTDVNVSKRTQRWRTALVLRELERELRAVEADAADHQRVRALMSEKMHHEHQANDARAELAGLPPDSPARADAEQRLAQQRADIGRLDALISPMLADDGHSFSKVWGLLLRAGNEKSHLTRQIERHADIYTSRVSNLLPYTPYAYFRSPRGSLPHDPGA